MLSINIDSLWAQRSKCICSHNNERSVMLSERMGNSATSQLDHCLFIVMMKFAYIIMLGAVIHERYRRMVQM